MKPLSLNHVFQAILLVLFTSGFSGHLLSQEDTGFTTIDLEEAEREYQALKEKPAFEKILILNDQLEKVTTQESVRFYTVKRKGFFAFLYRQTVMAVAVNNSGEEASRYFYLRKPYSQDPQFREIDRETAEAYWKKSQRTRKNAFSATIETRALNGLKSRLAGIFVKPGIVAEGPTFTIVGAKKTSDRYIEDGDHYKLDHPCPPDCSGYLNPYEE